MNEAKIRTRHLKYYLQLSELAESSLRGHTQIEWMARLNDERDNIRAALEWADKTDVEAGLYISGRLERVWEDFDVREGARWLTAFIENPESKAYPLARARALVTQAWLLQWLQQFDLGHSIAQECLKLYKTCGDQHGEIDALGLLAMVSDTSQALEYLNQALSLSQILRDRWRQAYVLREMGFIDNDKQRCKSYWKEANNLFREMCDWRSLAGNLSNLAQLEMLNGELESAQKWLDEAVKISQNLNNLRLNGGIIESNATLALIKGDYEMARAYIQKGRTIAEGLGHRWLLLWHDALLGYVTLRDGDLIEARDIFAKTTQNFYDDHSVDGILFTLEGMTGLYVAIDKPVIAARLIGWADILREQIKDSRLVREQADVDKIIAACMIKMGEVAFSDAYEEGKKMTLDEAVTYALRES